MDKHALFFIVSLVLLGIDSASKASQNPAEVFYQPYLQIGGTRFTRIKHDYAASFDLFVPLWQASSTELLFTDLRVYDRSGTPFEGNLHLGYRHLSPEKKHLYGIYGAFDRKRTEYGSYFNQLTLGGEWWRQQLFLGVNFYQPFGNTKKTVAIEDGAFLSPISNNIYNIWLTTDKKSEQAMRGIDVTIGYEVTPRLSGYIGGYYFAHQEVGTILGPKAKLAYDWSLNNEKKIGGIFDKVGLELGIQYDKSRQTICYFNINLRLGLTSKKSGQPPSMARHMVDLVKRDIDIVTTMHTQTTSKIYQEDGNPLAVTIINDAQQLLTTISDTASPTILLIPLDDNDKTAKIPTITAKKLQENPLVKVILGDSFTIISSTGHKHTISLAALNSYQNKKLSLMKLEQQLSQLTSSAIITPDSLATNKTIVTDNLPPQIETKSNMTTVASILNLLIYQPLENIKLLLVTTREYAQTSVTFLATNLKSTPPLLTLPEFNYSVR
jgi:hypothetical protein